MSKPKPTQKEIDWENEYELLRSAHSDIKDLTRERGDFNIPIWFGEPRKLPKRYSDILWKIDEKFTKTEYLKKERIKTLKKEDKNIT